MSFEGFQDGRSGTHLEYQKGTILVFPNLYVTPMPLIKFCLNRTYGWGKMLFEEFQDGVVAILDIRTEQFQQFWISM